MTKLAGGKAKSASSQEHRVAISINLTCADKFFSFLVHDFSSSLYVPADTMSQSCTTPLALSGGSVYKSSKTNTASCIIKTVQDEALGNHQSSQQQSLSLINSSKRRQVIPNESETPLETRPKHFAKQKINKKV